MNPGCSVNPVTGRPLESSLRPDETNAKAMARMEKAAAFLPVAESDAAGKLTAMIETVLYERICLLVDADPECRAVLSIMKAFDTQRDYARYAVAQLMSNQKP